MATATLQELLQPQFILDMVSRLRKGQGALAPWLGFAPNKFDPESVSLSGPATISGQPATTAREASSGSTNHAASRRRRAASEVRLTSDRRA